MATATKKTPKRKRGRPSIYTKTLGQKIFKRMRSGESIRSICRDPKMPSWNTIWHWMVDIPDFSTHYVRAREDQAEFFFEEMQEIADSATNLIVGDDKSDNARVNAVKLRVDTLKWRLARMAPKKYSDKVRNEHTGKDGGPIETKHIGRNGIEFITSDNEKAPKKKEQ